MMTKALGPRRWATLVMSAVLAIALVGWARSAWGLPQPATSEGSDVTAKINELAAKGGSLQDVIRVLGEPLSYRWGDQTFTKDNLPDRYIAVYNDGLGVLLLRGRVQEIRLERGQTEYRFEGKFGIGSSLEEVLAVLGEPGKTVSDQEVSTFEDNVLYRNCTSAGRHAQLL